MINEYSELISNEEQLEELLSRPGDELISMLSRIDGDIMFLGVGGKIGPSLASMAKRACEQSGLKKRIIGVSLFESEEHRKKMEDIGIETIHGDLLDMRFIKSLPTVKNLFFLAGMKFGSLDNLPLTWAVNTLLPALVAEFFKKSRIVAFSTGCVYPLVSVKSGGSLETDMPIPAGEYAQSCLGRERMFEYGSKKNNTPVFIIRLNYSVELRYGVLVDIAVKVKNKQPVDLSMGYFNVIWQGDVNDVVLRSIENADSPARVMNLTGPEVLSVREIAAEFGKLFDTDVRFVGKEANTALLSNSSLACSIFGKPEVSVSQLVQWTAGWMNQNGRLLGKPTHFEVRDGKY
jgi:nucleoside-diphosphate-sugar epimerase